MVQFNGDRPVFWFDRGNQNVLHNSNPNFRKMNCAICFQTELITGIFG